VTYSNTFSVNQNRLSLSTKKRHAINPEEWITPAEAARLRGVTRQAITKLINAGRLSTVSVGERLFVNRAEVESFTPKKPGRPAAVAKRR
jgi:excisionase family DNA binding protein